MPYARCCSAFAVLLFLFVREQGAMAQTSVYGSVALNNYGYVNNGSTAFKSDTEGVIGGLFYDFPIDSRLTAGVDVRGVYGFGARGGGLGAAALRVGFVPDRVVLRPYVEVGGAVISSTFNNNQITGPATQGLGTQSTRVTSGGLEFAGGLDVRLTRSFDLRAVELGAAAGGGNGGVGSAFLDAGIVYHLHPRPRRRP